MSELQDLNKFDMLQSRIAKLEIIIEKQQKELDYLRGIHNNELILKIEWAIENHLLIPFEVKCFENGEFITRLRFVNMMKVT